MKRFLPFSVSLLALSLASPSMAAPDDSVESLVQQGSVYDEKYAAQEALDFYLPAEKMAPENVDLLLRIARQYRHLMQDASGANEKLRLGNIAKEYAKRSIALAPSDPETHLSMAICHVKMVPILGNKEKMESSREIKASVDKALALNPKSDLGWHILGCWHQRLADINAMKRAIAMLVYGSLPEASNEEAVKCLQKAMALNPDRLIHHIELGRTYAQMGKAEDAKKHIEKGLSMPNVGKDDPEAKQRGRETLKELP